ncbi:hypothetical protein [uncultured Roseobacter sp.]|uniref:spike base protein, RCAP_Rcc01079 family n=1 Tax=uncultured Roseobacter sp. TaxID=114847 RepID=UPI00262C0C99|nr:hypothetical protein [uncultured Roseobacter sp.]
MADKFESFSEGLQSPPSNLVPIVPNDSTDLPNAVRSLNVAESGAVRVTTVSGNTATLFIAAGIAFPVRAQRVLSTGTTATGIVGMY